jgi:hypothetical protein
MKRILIIACLLVSTATCHAATQFDFLLSQVRTSTTSLVGGKVYFYVSTTTTPKAIWLDRNRATTAANPYTLDSNGTAQLYGTGQYRIVIKDAGGVTRYDRDNITVAGEDGENASIDATSGDQAESLPAGGTITYVKTDTTAHTVTISPSVGGQTIDGAATYVLSVGNESVTLSLSGPTWFIK